MRPVWWVCVCALAYGCGKEPRDGAAADAGVAGDAGASAALGARDESADAGVNDAAASAWSQFSRRDDVPLCLFARYADWGDAQFQSDAKPKVSLKANRPLYFGVYVPGCADPECMRRVTLQCWADVDGKSITVHSRFSGERQAEQPCANNCKPSTAACETPALKAGVYTLTHGAQQRTLRIPGVQQPACF